MIFFILAKVKKDKIASFPQVFHNGFHNTKNTNRYFTKNTKTFIIKTNNKDKI